MEIWFGIASGQILSIFDSYLSMACLNDNVSKYLWIFTKLGVHIDIVDICFVIANWAIFINF